MRIAFARWRSGGLFNRSSPRKRLLPKKKTSSGFEFVSGLAAGASAMPAKWSRRVFSFRFYEGKIRVRVTLTSCAFRKSYPGRNGPSALVHKPPTGAFTSRLPTDQSPFPSLDITTAVSGLLVWGFFCQGVSAERPIFLPSSVSLFDLKARFFVPTRHSGKPSRTGAVKAGRLFGDHPRGLAL